MSSSEPITKQERNSEGERHPIGQAVSHSLGDPQTFIYPLLWSFGGKEVDALDPMGEIAGSVNLPVGLSGQSSQQQWYTVVR
jgi:hypothetical protein